VAITLDHSVNNGARGASVAARRARAIAHYQRHIDDVKAAVPPEKLLIFKANEGWKPLCDFLGVPIPAQPFPTVNDRAQINKVIAGMTAGAYVILALGAAALAALIYGVTRVVG